MIKTTRYCDVCGREMNNEFFDQLYLPVETYDRKIEVSIEKKDICKKCLKQLYYKLEEMKHPNRRCPD